MEVKTHKGKRGLQLSQRILNAWQAGDARNGDSVHLLTGEDSLAVIIPRSLYQAEIELFKQKAGSAKILDQYLRSMMETISDDIRADIEKFSGRKVRDAIPIVDLKGGYISTLYRF